MNQNKLKILRRYSTLLYEMLIQRKIFSGIFEWHPKKEGGNVLYGKKPSDYSATTQESLVDPRSK